MSPFSLPELHAQFIKEKRFLDNLSENTIRSYKLALQWFTKLGGDFDKTALSNFVIGLREAGMNPNGCNVKIRSMNSFLTWCFHNGHNPENGREKFIRVQSSGDGIQPGLLDYLFIVGVPAYNR